MASLQTLQLLLVSSALVSCSKVRNVYWNTTTTGSSDEPLTVTVNEDNLPWEYDQVNLICPVVKDGVGEQHVIYSVEKEEYDNCRVTSPRPRIVAVCNRPDTFMYFTITFRSFTPTPGGLEFRPGKEYYFISTANTRDIHRRVGGWCKSHNMKMIVKVAENKVAEEATTWRPKPIPTPAAFWSQYWNSRVPSTKEKYHYSDSDRVRTAEGKYHYGKQYQQTRAETYFSQQSQDVEIRIAARTSSSSVLVHSVGLFLSSALMFVLL